MEAIQPQKIRSPKKKYPYSSFREYAKQNMDIMQELYKTASLYSAAYMNDLFCDYHHVIIKDGIELLANHTSEFVNIKNNIRCTTDQPDDWKNTIQIYGDSRIVGIGVEDKHTLPSCLQALLNKHCGTKQFCVQNYGVGSITPLKIYNKIIRQKWNTGDILILFVDLHNGMGEIDNGHIQALITLNILKNITEFCKKNGVLSLFLQFPTLQNIISPSPREQKLALMCFDDDKTIVEVFNFNIGFSKLSTLCISNGITFTDTTGLFHRPHLHGEVFIDHVHLNHAGHKLIVSFLLDALLCHFEAENLEQSLNEVLQLESLREYERANNMIHHQIESYIESILASCTLPLTTNNGAIVMNCNPFTKGHLFLIEECSKHVETLFIFVVEEDRSYFEFNLRYEMVKNGTNHIHNVVVVPSGSFIISSTTLPEYFTKDTYKSHVDAQYDLEIFAKYIAPRLHICIRFVGEEPFCPVTRQYNVQMKSILPKHGIGVVIVPRLKADGEDISATKVRNYLENKNFDALPALLPPSTLALLEKH